MKLIFKSVHKLFCTLAVLMLVSCGVKKSLHDIPDVTQFSSEIPERTTINDSTFALNNNFLTKNKQGQWELLVSGNPLQLGLKTGRLTQELFAKQEAYFLGKVETMVPSKFKQKLLRKLMAWYNRKMYLHIPEEFKTEIYGLAQYAGDDYDYIADDYLRILYLHGAHDIGHAFQDLALVGCSSFAVWGDKTSDGSMLIGRNLDFYAGDDFAKQKIIAFVKPESGYNFMSVTWPGMIGVVSGMNEKGLTVTINAGKSKIPLVAKTPISILTREILQYASNIEEAVAIAKKRQVFVSESIFIGSAADKNAVTIEVSPKNFGVYQVPNANQLICTNHFQSDAYKTDDRNAEHIHNSHSQYRYERLQELINEEEKITPQKAVAMLRNREGLHDLALGYGNEKALNQLLAHHGVVFKPEQGLVWVSSNPYNLGEFVAYNLNDVFAKAEGDFKSNQTSALNIETDPFLYSEAYKNYENYRVESRKLSEAISNNTHINTNKLEAFKQLNPNFWEAYYLVGKYFYEKKYYTAALLNFEAALTKEVTTVPDRENLKAYIKKIKRKL
ncbi:acyl-CoA:6-aminopenicillanic acid acyl-transferase [Tamlana nanhaiensis]|uniref:Acyl-CoA:6-aminopenicillanic acid acyl-transferase n=1 Tax=Neotamlana nanhaiensis TaxID=1382798 RepID=A0A0D7VYZ6_9FLAO|nr:acyl-CoA--6-aminopenicillanic acid acyl-transferase [Tamlana nanhaiensis]KJD32110.1 acyl-CoA:6-aminopenicillanic acid acyl-transferase [Tamlana nanhaiensis]KJD32272.1 acyl-CoA:6-aminopenicillanic acid acyl-transferase [Tamlana nanhaiensis]